MSHSTHELVIRGIQSYVCQYACSLDSVICVPILCVPILRETDMSVRLCANTHVRGIQSYVCQYACSWDSVTCVPIRMFVGFSHVCQYVCANTHVRGIQSYVCQYYVPILRETDMSVRLCANTHVRENQSYVRQYSVRHVSQCDGSESNVRATRMSVSWRT